MINPQHEHKSTDPCAYDRHNIPRNAWVCTAPHLRHRQLHQHRVTHCSRVLLCESFSSVYSSVLSRSAHLLARSSRHNPFAWKFVWLTSESADVVAVDLAEVRFSVKGKQWAVWEICFGRILLKYGLPLTANQLKERDKSASVFQTERDLQFAVWQLARFTGLLANIK